MDDRRIVKVGAAAGLLVTLLFVPGPHDEPGTVVYRDWERTVTVSDWRMRAEHGWRDGDALVEHAHVDPVDGTGEQAGCENIRDCSREIRTWERVPAGSHEVCVTSDRRGLVDLLVPTAEARAGGGQSFSAPRSSYSPSSGYRPSGGSGYHVPTTHCHSVTDYTSVPVYDDRCTYDTWAWEPEAPVTASGSWEPPMWPAVEAGMLQKTTRRERYRVTVGYGERHAWTMEVPAADFAAWPVGAPATVHLFWGWVTGVEHATPAVAAR
jgi:hypothetical protein